MLSRLTTPFKARLELSFSRRDDEHSNVCLRSARNHVRHVGLVAWCIQQGPTPVDGLKVRTANFHSLTLGLLLLVRVHNVGQEPTVSVLVPSLLLVFFDRPFINTAAQVQHVPTRGGFARINMANEDNVQVSPWVRLLPLAIVCASGYGDLFLLEVVSRFCCKCFGCDFFCRCGCGLWLFFLFLCWQFLLHNRCSLRFRSWRRALCLVLPVVCCKLCVCCQFCCWCCLLCWWRLWLNLLFGPFLDLRWTSCCLLSFSCSLLCLVFFKSQFTSTPLFLGLSLRLLRLLRLLFRCLLLLVFFKRHLAAPTSSTLAPCSCTGALATGGPAFASATKIVTPFALVLTKVSSHMKWRISTATSSLLQTSLLILR
mmetsp:Transcript_34091/g.67103  ORF Transcript_34091/g.67103 Transcript_34091/m.67103 type:complete len:369 (-) Transcript_34091:319-1425(-)